MEIITKDNLSKKEIDEISKKYIKDRFIKTRALSIIYLILIILSSVILILNIIPNTTTNVILMVVAFIGLMLLYDSFKETLALSKATKLGYSKVSGTFYAKKAKNRKAEFLIDKEKLYSVKELNFDTLEKYDNKKVTGYFIGKHIFLLYIKH